MMSNYVTFGDLIFIISTYFFVRIVATLLIYKERDNG